MCISITRTILSYNVKIKFFLLWKQDQLIPCLLKITQHLDFSLNYYHACTVTRYHEVNILQGKTLAKHKPVGKAKARVSVKVTLWSPFSSSSFLSITIFYMSRIGSLPKWGLLSTDEYRKSYGENGFKQNWQLQPSAEFFPKYPFSKPLDPENTKPHLRYNWGRSYYEV